MEPNKKFERSLLHTYFSLNSKFSKDYGITTCIIQGCISCCNKDVDSPKEENFIKSDIKGDNELLENPQLNSTPKAIKS